MLQWNQWQQRLTKFKLWLSFKCLLSSPFPGKNKLAYSWFQIRRDHVFPYLHQRRILQLEVWEVKAARGRLSVQGQQTCCMIDDSTWRQCCKELRGCLSWCGHLKRRRGLKSFRQEAPCWEMFSVDLCSSLRLSRSQGQIGTGPNVGTWHCCNIWEF